VAAILSYADLARDDVTSESTLADLDSIQSAARKGAALTRQLLQFSRREGGESSDVDLNERVHDVVSMLERTLGEDVRLLVSTTDEATIVHADAVELDQVLLNLIVNARDALEPGGTIRIETARRDLGGTSPLLPGVPSGAYVQLSVRDDGSGMTEEVMEHAFEPFFTTKGRGQGTGLGLATVYGIVQRHEGHVSLRSTPDVGTTIEVLLPVSQSLRPATADADEAPVPGQGDGRTVLLVEDEAPLRLAMRRMLERGGYRVLDAEDGPAALRNHHQAEIDLLLTDIVMPGTLTGVDVADRFRDRAERLPVVFVTGYSDAALDGRRVDSAGTTVLAKPFSEAELLGAVRQAIGSAP
jgi:CheY-like chemotaxis protein